MVINLWVRCQFWGVMPSQWLFGSWRFQDSVCGSHLEGFHKVQGIFWLAEGPLTSQEGLCWLELMHYIEFERYYINKLQESCSILIMCNAEILDNFINFVMHMSLFCSTCIRKHQRLAFTSWKSRDWSNILGMPALLYGAHFTVYYYCVWGFLC